MNTVKLRSNKLSRILAVGFTLGTIITNVCAGLSNVQAQGSTDVTRAAGSFRIESNNQIFFVPADGSNPVRVYDGSQRALAVVRYNEAIYTAFSGGGIYRSPNGQNLGGGGNTQRIYLGQKVIAMTVCRGGIFTAFDRAGIYYSPNGQNPGGGGRTSRVYRGTQLVNRMLCQPGSGINGTESVVTTFTGAGVYQSPDGNNLGGGGQTRRLN